MRSIIVANDETLESCEAMVSEGGPTSDEFDRLTEENVLLESLIPSLLSKQEIVDFFKEVGVGEIKDAASDGQAVGRAMRALSSASKSVDGKIVQEVVGELRK